MHTAISQSDQGTDYMEARHLANIRSIERATSAMRRTPSGKANGVRIYDESGCEVRVCYLHGPSGRVERIDGSECGASNEPASVAVADPEWIVYLGEELGLR